MKSKPESPPSNGVSDTHGKEGERGNAARSGVTATTVKEGMSQDMLHARLIELESRNEELRQTRLTMEAALERYANLYDFAPVGYFTLSETGVIVEANQTGMAQLGAARSQLMGHKFSSFLSEPSRAGFDAFLKSAPDGTGKAVCEAVLWGGAPQVRDVRIHGMVADAGENEPRTCRIAVTDITDVKKSEREQAVLQAQMRQAQRMESLGMLAGGVAHDFNNMLMAISGNAGLVLEELPEDSPARPMVREIVTVSGRAADLCGQMLAYAGKGHFRMAPLSLSKMAAEMSHMLSLSVSRKTVISCRLHESLPLVRADAVQLRQVLMNLVLNAAEAIGERSGSISISTGVRECSREYLLKVRSAAGLEPGPHVFLEVADTGCGMDQHTVERMFDPFFSTKAAGRGLGLSAAVGVINAHSGGIGVQTEPDRGTTITLLFPPEPVSEKAETVPPGVRALWKGRGTVLLVDDEESIRTVCRRMLEYLGLEVLVASDGRRAIELFRQYREVVSCVLLDFAMPHLDGEQTFHELRKIDPSVRVILSSGYLVEDVAARFEGQGLTGFIHKPYQLEQLTEVLKAVFAE